MWRQRSYIGSNYIRSAVHRIYFVNVQTFGPKIRGGAGGGKDLGAFASAGLIHDVLVPNHAIVDLKLPSLVIPACFGTLQSVFLKIIVIYPKLVLRDYNLPASRCSSLMNVFEGEEGGGFSNYFDSFSFL